MMKITILISICYERGHHFHVAKYRLRPFAKQGLLQAYLTSSLFFSGKGMSILNGAFRHFSSIK
jgi:hypothetical protein